MNQLSTALLDPATRPQVVDALVQLAESEVAAKKGVGGTMLRTAYAGVRKAGEGTLRKAVDALLPGVASTLDPHFAAKGEQAFGSYLSDPARSGQVAEELLAVADARVRAVEGRPLGRIYASLRGRAKEHVVTALPALGAALERFTR